MGRLRRHTERGFLLGGVHLDALLVDVVLEIHLGSRRGDQPRRLAEAEAASGRRKRRGGGLHGYLAARVCGKQGYKDRKSVV